MISIVGYKKQEHSKMQKGISFEKLKKEQINVLYGVRIAML